MATTIPAPPTATTRSSSRLARRERTWGLIFLAPWIVGFLLFFFDFADDFHGTSRRYSKRDLLPHPR